MNELALFAGAGGGILGGLLLGWRTVAAVEIDPYCRQVLLQRQADGCLPRFPIWDDIHTFDGTEWRGRVDVVSGGFPCQAFSTAARGRNTALDLWPEMLRVVREVCPRFVFAENVQRDPVERAAADLRALGYFVPDPARIAASCVGAPHRRPRWWVAADTHGKGERIRAKYGEVASVSSLAGELWPEPGAEVLGDDARLPHRMDRLKAIGNGQVPAVAALAWGVLRENS